MSLRTRLTLGIFAIVLASIAVVYLYVTPTLEARLRDQRIDRLRDAAERYGDQLRPTIGTSMPAKAVASLVTATGQQANFRVTLLNVPRGPLSRQPIAVGDSAGGTQDSGLDFAIARRAAQTRRLVTGWGAGRGGGGARRAAQTRRVVTGWEAGQGGRVAEAARPLFRGRSERVVVFSSSLSDVSDTVGVIRSRVLVAGALALLVALIGGGLVARALSARIKRLERGAQRVARGDFSARVPFDRPDELGQLALALDDMQSQLAQLDSARKRFIATASHELRTPIFSLGGFIELLQDEDLSDDEREAFLTQMRDQVTRLQVLATELLDLSRLEAGALELRPEHTDLGGRAEAVTSEFLPALTRHGSHLELRLPREGVEAVCDPERVAQILRILIDNALTHTPEGTNVVVSASRANGAVGLTVRDFGPGIRHTEIARIFEPFYTSDDARGSGLGLAIAHELAERMAGRLAVESQPGRTIFSFELPS